VWPVTGSTIDKIGRKNHYLGTGVGPQVEQALDGCNTVTKGSKHEGSHALQAHGLERHTLPLHQIPGGGVLLVHQNRTKIQAYTYLDMFE
jgi:hypothetical protein